MATSFYFESTNFIHLEVSCASKRGKENDMDAVNKKEPIFRFPIYDSSD